jgi:pantoate--beta-alanine ligase
MTQVIRTSAELREKVAAWKRSGMLVGVVPTMGALHDGHLSLARAAREQSDRVIVTIFVNPMQFNNPDDLTKYPRDEAHDLALLEAEGVDVLFAPGVDEVYPDGFATTVSVSGVSEPLEGAFRPGHFDGVATVVSKLFGMTQADGLAMSSRNVRLSAVERAQAPALHQIMQAAAAEIRDGAPVGETLMNAQAAILEAGFGAVEYLELRSVEGLRPITSLSEPARMLVAAQLGDVRLIDNIAV